MIGSKEVKLGEFTTTVFLFKMHTTIIPITARAQRKIMHISIQSLMRAAPKYLIMLSDFLA